MYITKYLEKVGLAFIAGKDKEICVNCKTPLHFQHYLEKKFNASQHDAAAILRFTNSEFVLVFETCADIPIRDVIDPFTGKYLLKYGDLKIEKEKVGVIIDGE